MDTNELPTVLMSNKLEVLFQRLKQNCVKSLADPFSRRQILVSDPFMKTALEVALAQENGIVLGIEVKSLAELATDTVDEIHLYAVSGLSKPLNDYFFSLCPNTKVFYYVLSPCMHFWSDVCTDQEAKRLIRKLNSKHAEAVQEYLYDRSKLLANNLTSARELVRYLEEKLEDFEEHYVVKDWVHSEFVRHEVASIEHNTKPTLLGTLQNDLLLMARTECASDKTVQVHKAPTLLREVEVLYLYIQEALKTVKGRIVVLACDIEVYKPYIRSLFTHSAEIVGTKVYEILPCFLDILKTKKLQPKMLFSYFRQRGLSSDDLGVLARCLETFDDLERDCILSWITSSYSSLELSNTDAHMLGSCLEVVQTLQTSLQSLAAEKTRTCREWLKLFIAILDTYFLSSCDEFYTLKKALSRAFRANVLIDAVEKEHAIAIFTDTLKEVEIERSPNLQSRIIFANLGEVRTLEKDVVCLLGMAEGTFPRSKNHKVVDLSFLDERPSIADRHLVIEAILTTKEMLYISYQSYAFKERVALHPAGIVTEILETLDIAVTEHGLESSCENEYTPHVPKVHLEKVDALIPDVISIQELSQVAKHPLKAYFQHGLGLYLHDYNPKVSLSEFDVLTPKHFAMLKRQAFVEQDLNQEFRKLPSPLKYAAVSLVTDEVDELSENAKLLGLQKDAPMQIELSLSCKNAQELAPGAWKLPAIEVDISGRRIRLVGLLTNIYPQGIITFEAKSQKPLYKVWPDILMLNLIKDTVPITPQLLYIKEGKLEMVDILDPAQKLADYVAYALQARGAPSCLYPHWIDALMEHELPPEKLLIDNPYAYSDPYLDLYLSRVPVEAVENEWPAWKNLARTLFERAAK